MDMRLKVSYSPVRRCASILARIILHIWAYPNMETHIMALGFVDMPKYGHASVRSATPKYGVCRSCPNMEINHPQIWSCVTSDLRPCCLTLARKQKSTSWHDNATVTSTNRDITMTTGLSTNHCCTNQSVRWA